MFPSKIKAAIIHLAISLLVVGIVIGIILWLFFPTLFLNVSDFKEVAGIIVMVDLVLGPLLTFVVFQPKKKSLNFDLSIVATVQIIALAYGGYSLFQVHPVYVAFNIDRFTLVSAKDAEPENASLEQFKVSKLSSATLAFAQLPLDQEKQEQLMIESISGGEDLDRKEEYYRPVKDHISEILSKSLNPELIFNSTTSKKEFFDKNKDKLSAYAFLPLNSLNKDAIIVIERESLIPVATLDIDPWNL